MSRAADVQRRKFRSAGRRDRPGAIAQRDLGRELRGLRTSRGVTQRGLAARSGVQQAEISRIEAGSANPTVSTLAALASALDAALTLAPRRPAPRATAPVGKQRRFLCLICAATPLERMARAEAEEHLAQYRVLMEDLTARGQVIACERLVPAEAATTVRVRKGRVSVTDGPFAETKELIGGYLIVAVRSRAEAVRVASRIPAARLGCVEVRAIADDPATLAALGPAASGAGRAPAVDPGGRRSSMGHRSASGAPPPRGS